MESLESAQSRGVPIIAEYLGGAVTCDAHHMTDPRADGLGVSPASRSPCRMRELHPRRSASCASGTGTIGKVVQRGYASKYSNMYAKGGQTLPWLSEGE